MKEIIENAMNGDADALFMLGNYFLNEKDKIIFNCISKAAEQGHAKAQYYLGNFYFYGNYIDKNIEKTIYWYEKSAEQGYYEAQHQIGEIYFNGEHVKNDYYKAVQWFTKAAEQDYEPAQFSLSTCYEEGKGVEKDLNKAKYWFDKASEKEDAEAQKNIELCINNEKCDIDTDIIPVIKALWKAGIKTIYSCAGHEGKWHEAYICFRKHEEFKNYLLNKGIKVLTYNGGYSCNCRDFLSLPTESEIKAKRDEFLRILEGFRK